LTLQIKEHGRFPVLFLFLVRKIACFSRIVPMVKGEDDGKSNCKNTVFLAALDSGE